MARTHVPNGKSQIKCYWLKHAGQTPSWTAEDKG